MKKNTVDEEDDGRTIVDMSGVDRPSLLAFRRPRKKEPEEPELIRDEGEEPGSFLWKEGQRPFTPEERRIYVLAALKASLFIGAFFIIGLGLAILVMALVWSR